MKQSLLLLGGFVGFAICFATGLAAGSDIGQVLFNASIGCMVGGIMFKWISVLLVESLQMQRRKASLAAEKAATAAAKEAKK